MFKIEWRDDLLVQPCTRSCYIDGERVGAWSPSPIEFAETANERERERDEARVEVERLKAEVDRYQEREATVCPEDFSFEEVIKSLRAEAERLTQGKAEAESFYGDQACAEHDRAEGWRTEALAARPIVDGFRVVAGALRYGKSNLGKLWERYVEARAANEGKP